jgi:transcriptional regulator of acetoin/glycerol metabolism
VRELENAIEHAFVICRHEEIDTRDLPTEIRPGQRLPPLSATAGPPHHYRAARDLTRERLVELLHASGWNKAEAARRLGISRTAVWKYMKKWEIPLRGED